VRLTVETGPLAGTVVSLDRNAAAILGSGADCAIRVQEAGVAEQHAVVKALKDQGFGIKALAPGVRLNGSPLEAAALQDGDVIELGTTRIAFGQLQQRGLPKIPGYRILGELGRGGMGMVYRAEQVSLHRQVALKVLNQELTKDPQFVAKFVAEARAAAKLQHPNVVQVFDVEHDGGLYYYAMELMPEGSLEDWLRQHGAMPAERAMQVILDAAAGLAYAESLRIVHRDIKPDNLMLDQHGAVKIADLGLAGSSEESEEKAIGTPHFMAPEQVQRRELDHRTDLYALGCTFYRLVTGKTPFRGQTVKDILRAQVKDEAEPAHKANPQVPAEVSAIIQKLMAKEPKDRYQSATELQEQLQQLLQPPAKKGLWIGLAATAVLVAGGAIYWAVNKPKEQTIVEKYRDNPEMLRLATENEQLKQAAREDAATIALLTTRTAGLEGGELAAALDRVAAAHAGAKAATEAKERAVSLRQQLADQQKRREEQQRAVETFVQSLQAVQQPLLAGHRYGEAEQALAREVPAELRDDATLAAALVKLRQELQQAAEGHLKRLQQDVQQARDARNAGQLVATTDRLRDAVGQASLWPKGMLPTVEAARQTIAEAQQALSGLQQAQREANWQQYHQLLRGEQGAEAALRRLDFVTAAGLLRKFAEQTPGEAPGQQAAALADAMQQAEAFAGAFDKAIAQGQVQYRSADGNSQPVLRWDRSQRQVVIGDTSRRPVREVVLSPEMLSPEVWLALVEQVTPPMPGMRECFLGFLLLHKHIEAARSYLARLQPGDDQSGTGAGGYPLGSQMLDLLATRLPEDGAHEWARAMRRELQACERLAAGLRAFSERRNRAAAGHLEQLHAAHAHSVVVAMLP
jgi:serine/threonine-protein kinase